MADIQKKIAEAQVRFTEEEKHKTGLKQEQEKNLALASTFLKTAVASMAHNVVQLNRNLENVIQQREETPYREGENDMAKRVKLSIPNEYGGGWATGATKEEATAQLLKRCGVTRQSVNQNIPLYSDYAQRWYDLTWKPKENGVKNSWKDPKRAIEESKLYFQGQRLDEITKSKIQEDTFNQLYYISNLDNVQKTHYRGWQAILEKLVLYFTNILMLYNTSHLNEYN
mgnify:CR=1 FL=1